MSKAILISIKPKWVAKILNGEKTIEIRKTMPKCDLPIDVYIYCTKGGKKDWHLIEVVDTDTGWEGYEYDYYIGSKGYLKHCLEGKVVAKFTLNKVEEIKFDDKDIQRQACLSEDELFDYLFVNIPYNEDMRKGYAWFIDNLVIFDKPKELSEFYKISCKGCPFENTVDCCKPYTHIYCKITKAPQSWCYVEV